MTPEPIRDESFSRLVRQFQTDLIALVDTEKALAKRELSAKATEVKHSAIELSGAAVMGLLGAMCLVASAALALATVMAAWLATLIVGLVIGSIGAAMFLKFKKNMENFDPVPRHTVNNIERDVRAVKEAAR